eukprot:873600-Prymnesium_polylepis.1
MGQRRWTTYMQNRQSAEGANAIALPQAPPFPPRKGSSENLKRRPIELQQLGMGDKFIAPGHHDADSSPLSDG